MSRLSFNIFCVFFVSVHFSLAQQKANDFTKRLGFLEGKQSRLSGRFFNSGKLPESFSKRIKIEEWPSRYSPFGGKRFTTSDTLGLIKKRVPLRQELPLEQRIRSDVNLDSTDTVEGLSHETRFTSVATVEFRDAYYAKLNQRMDEWMEKVNNLSLRDINRFQFRRGRPAEPGFPVQRAGSNIIESTKSSLPLGSSVPSSRLPTTYQVEPRKTSIGSSGTMKPEVRNQPQPQSSSLAQPSRDPQPPVPRYGPKKIRVQVNSIE